MQIKLFFLLKLVMALDAGSTETTEIAETVEVPIEQPSEPLETAPEAEIAAEAAEVPAETAETTEDAETEAAEPVVATVAEDPITFDVAADISNLTAQTTEVLNKYELPAEVQAVIDVWKAKAEAVPDTAIISELSDYGEPEVIKTALGTYSQLLSVTEMPDGSFRPNTDKFVANFVEDQKPEVVDHLYFDLANTPSQKYPGVLRFEEGIVDAIAVPGDTVGSALARYQEVVQQAKSGAVRTGDVPKYIADLGLQSAYHSLSKESREEMDAYDPQFDVDNEYAGVRQNKLAELGKIQKGIDADIRDNQRTQAEHQQKIADRNTQIIQTQNTFYDGVRDQFTEALLKESVFPTSLAARQNVTLLMQACRDDSDGEYARAALETDGIKFDFPKVKQLVTEVNAVSIELTNAKSTVDAQGRQLNEFALRSATRKFEEVTRKWLEFGTDILKQEQKLTASGTAKAVEQEVVKIKIAPKARAVPKGVATPVKKAEERPAYKSPEWYGRITDREVEKARTYA